jgi:hypothetical protein
LCFRIFFDSYSSLEAFMQDYEIRIFGLDKEPEDRSHTIIEMVHLNDTSALRAARTLAAGQRFEVWRGLERIDFEDRPKRPAH